MKTKKWSLAVAALACFAVAAGSCGGGGGTNGASDLFVDLHTLMPTANEQPTPDQPNPINASRYIAAAYEELTGTSIHWASDYAKPTDTITNIRSWYTTQINVRNCPAIGFSFGTGMQEDNLYVDLTEYLELPNPYVEGNEHWRDCFEDWVWTDPDVLDANGRIVSIPLILAAGSPTAVYYNKDLFEENGLEIPRTWREFSNTADALRRLPGITYAYAPYAGDTGVSLSSWAVTYSLAPGFAKHMTDRTDYDGDGVVTTNELLRAVLEDEFNPNTCQEARALYTLAYQYYTTFLPTGWQSVSNWLTPWDEGRIGMKSQGLWYYTTETSDTLRSFEFDIFAPPVAQSDSSAYASDLEYKTLEEGYEAPVLMAFNIMKPAVEDNPELLERAIDFLMYLTAPDAVTAIVEEKGEGIPAVKDAGYPSLFDDAGWLDNSFAVINDSEWPLGFITANTANINAAFNDWVLGQSTQQEFFTILNREQKAGAQTMVDNMGIDTSGWNI